jgi:thiosulfate dehydrogenase [quinone] large subunit
MWVFAYLGQFSTPPGRPIRLMYQTEAAFAIVTVFCLLLTPFLRKPATCIVVAFIGGISAGFGMMMPLELAPFFFEMRGEAMLGTILLVFVYPVAIAIFIGLFVALSKPARDWLREH